MATILHTGVSMTIYATSQYPFKSKPASGFKKISTHTPQLFAELSANTSSQNWSPPDVQQLMSWVFFFLSESKKYYANLEINPTG